MQKKEFSRSMGKAGRVLRQVLQNHSTSQNKLAVTMGLKNSVVGRWYHEQVDPTGDTIVKIVTALQELNPEAAAAFVQLYLGDIIASKNQDESS